ncbi:hypothetical protein ZIOFF_039511 [Zingiber officinale]|uniref:Uncharacterized protein n=1 Tax=Zingiber officinale TaxID=94328 RepID=A0A8J5L3X0_ZINOF|nr:hypothetical protein ZIOFF_039511 [Zingiber officinale]
MSCLKHGGAATTVEDHDGDTDLLESTKGGDGAAVIQSSADHVEDGGVDEDDGGSHWRWRRWLLGVADAAGFFRAQTVKARGDFWGEGSALKFWAIEATFPKQLKVVLDLLLYAVRKKPRFLLNNFTSTSLDLRRLCHNNFTSTSFTSTLYVLPSGGCDASGGGGGRMEKNELPKEKMKLKADKQFATLRSFEEVDSLGFAFGTVDFQDDLEAKNEFAMKISNFANIILLVLKIYATIRTKSMAIVVSTLDSLLNFMAGGIL